MNCEQALILISAALDGEITPEEREQLNTHLDLCAECRSIADDFGLISAALAEEAEVPADLTERMTAAVKNTAQNKKRTFLRRYGSMAAMLALVISLGAIALSGGRGMNDVALFNGMGAAKMDAAAPAEAAPMPSTAAAKGSMYEFMADSVHFDAKVVAEAQVGDAGYDLKTEEDAEDVALYGGAGDAGASTKPVENTTPFHEPPTAEEPVQYDPPDHATIHAALELVVNELMSVDGMDAPLEEDYFYCVLERTADGKQKEETRLEYFGLSDNGKYYMFSLRMYTVTAPDSPAQGAEYITDFNNFAVPREMDEVLREFDENRSPEHQKAYLKALVD